ncbi:MAG: ATP phosphoribosyltransferase [Flavobacteriales bacterium]|tara:strand:- start:995 stop:1873 length:879 start_codon:yes stop_codon:yes gene_type:complete
MDFKHKKSKMIRIAIQKSGRLNQDSLRLLKDCGISIDNGKDQLKASARNFPMEVFFLRNGDIPQYMRDGVVDIAILGENLLIEKGNELEVIEKLGFSKCRVSIAIPKGSHFSGIKDLEGKKIATSYPKTVKAFLEENRIKADLHIINGSVEIAPNIGLADAICDIVSSGSTLFKNNLKEVIEIKTSEAVLVQAPVLSDEKKTLIEKLQFRIQAVLRAKKSKYILMNVPNEKIDAISSILPVLKSPTVLPLAKKGWSSLHSVINAGDFWEVIDALKINGAEDILVCPIEKMVL